MLAGQYKLTNATNPTPTLRTHRTWNPAYSFTSKFSCYVNYKTQGSPSDLTIRPHHSTSPFEPTIRTHHSTSPFDLTTKSHH